MNALRLSLVAGFAAMLVAATATQAREASDTDSQAFAVTGNVPPLCSGGTLSEADGSFDLGTLVDTTTGFLRTDLSAPAQVMGGAFCSARSTISVSATRLAAVNYTTTPPAGFSREIDYTATASGWTPTAATFATAASSNPGAVQTRDDAFTGAITVGVSGFATNGGSTLRPVADTEYRGIVTVTLSAAD